MSFDSIDINKDNPNVRRHNIFADLKGEFRRAIEKLSWFKWGRYYIPSLLQAHMQERCNNFKDPGVQGYGHAAFNDLVKHGEKVFSETELKPKIAPLNPPTRDRLQPVTTNRQSMSSRYYNSSGGCILGKSQIFMADGTQMELGKIKSGDLVRTSFGKGEARVKYVVEFTNSDGFDIINIGSLFITPWHPVYIDFKWTFPHDVAPSRLFKFHGPVYTLVLDGGGDFIACSIPVAALAHNYVGDVIEHPFWGTAKVIDDLLKISTWTKGGTHAIVDMDVTIIEKNENGQIVHLVK